MELIRSDSRATRLGKPEWFTGRVLIDEIASRPAPSRLNIARVTFEPGARTHWHTHPVGQVLHILSGAGRIQLDGGPLQLLLPGDTVMIAPGEKHWHGAAPDRLFVHLAVQESENGYTADWLEAVSDDQYNAVPSIR